MVKKRVSRKVGCPKKILNKRIVKNNQLGQMFKGSDFNYTAAITTKCPHFLQIVLENKLTREYP